MVEEVETLFEKRLKERKKGQVVSKRVLEYSIIVIFEMEEVASARYSNVFLYCNRDSLVTL